MIWYSLGVARSPDCDLMEGGAELAWLGAGEWVGLRAGLIPSQWGDPGLYLLLLAFSFAYVDAFGSNPMCRSLVSACRVSAIQVALLREDVSHALFR